MKLLSAVFFSALFANTALAITVNVTELDQKYTLYTKCVGSSYTNELPANTTTSVTIQNGNTCTIEYGKGGIKSGDLKELKGGEKFTVKNGELKKK